MLDGIESWVYVGVKVVEELHLHEEDHGSDQSFDDCWAWREEGATDDEDQLPRIGDNNFPEEGVVVKPNEKETVASYHILIIKVSSQA